ncbi:solute carrier family 22 (organic anion transporter), member 7 [Rattus norvegicus]|uniref:Solute carrier family 22 member 7 n=3 Tax=Rattus norvegicus TaxID=10116 RepID=S22A7_RAT|nr:solute carrier family 22 member 7 [Rattus norvegicus]Q5RLM2.1 RecName: Full=Solute carrier family 22 member 7; AltName: Full=Novel liver transporter; AltName: Full=Organic anion transporter 2; Short=rOAT2 [Rattus norvegicus]AAV66454.1 organic anion transporter 2 [Rattus norvegicus]EDM18823.1 solute carrier family 22 (organic anion transporter), member 7 [Rattus norvegicus]|eukprot:NP_445989.2 solute carrier family 22 member 7 [Rattus norvegicus]
MGFEDLLDKVGGFGPFQLRNLVLMALPRMLLPMHFLLPVFMAAVPAHHCALPGAPANLSHQDLWLEAHLPRETDGSFSSCLRFAYPQTVPNVTLGTEVSNSGEPEGEPLTVPCSQGWEYDRSEFSSTIATEWDLVCQQRGLNKITSTCFFIGVLVGAVVYGYLSDRFGRRRLLLVAYVSSLVLGLMSAASINYIMFVVTRTLTGSALAGFTIIVLPLELEWLDVEHRTVAGVISTVFWSGGVLLLALVGYLIRSWRWLLLAATLPCVPGIISIWWVPESARWLLTQGRVEEAKKYLLSCAKLNGRPVGEGSLSQEALNNVVTMERALQRPSYLDLFRTSQLRHISLCCMMVWFGVNFSYYGLTLDVSGLGLNVYQTQLLFGAVELPSKIMVYFLVRRLGRRLTEAGMLLGAALTFGTSLLVSLETKSWITALVVVGKAFSEAAFTTAYLFTSELYPTVLRQTGLGLTALMGRLGASLAPLAALLDGVWLLLPKVAYGGIALVAACTALLLPETKKAQLPETIQDVERKSTQEEDV